MNLNVFLLLTSRELLFELPFTHMCEWGLAALVIILNSLAVNTRVFCFTLKWKQSSSPMRQGE